MARLMRTVNGHVEIVKTGVGKGEGGKIKQIMASKHAQVDKDVESDGVEQERPEKGAGGDNQGKDEDEGDVEPATRSSRSGKRGKQGGAKGKPKKKGFFYTS